MSLTYEDAVNALRVGHLQRRVNVPIPTWRRVLSVDKIGNGKICLVHTEDAPKDVLVLSQETLDHYPDEFRAVSSPRPAAGL